MGEKLRTAMSTLRQAPAALLRVARGRGPQKAVLVPAAVVVLLIGAVAWFVVARSDDSSADEAEVADPPATSEAPAPTTTDTTAPETTTTTSPWTEEEQEVIDAYEAAVDAAMDAEADPNGEHDLEATHTGLELDQRIVEVDVLASNSQVRQFPHAESPVYEREVVEVTVDSASNSAEVIGCTVSNRQELWLATGAIESDTLETRTVESRNLMELSDGIWKLAEFEMIDRQEGLAGCAQD